MSGCFRGIFVAGVLIADRGASGGGPIQSGYPADFVGPVLCVSWPGQGQSQGRTAARYRGRGQNGASRRPVCAIFLAIPGRAKSINVSPARISRCGCPRHISAMTRYRGEIELLRVWIEQGAKYQSHWAFIPPQKAARPAVNDAAWPRNEIDYFVLSRWIAKSCSRRRKPINGRCFGGSRWI